MTKHFNTTEELLAWVKASRIDRHTESCQGKKRYASRAEAQETKKHEQRRLRQNRLHAYFCGVCNHWHLGKMHPKRKHGNWR